MTFDQWWDQPGTTTDTAHLCDPKGFRTREVMEAIKSAQRKAWNAALREATEVCSRLAQEEHASGRAYAIVFAEGTERCRDGIAALKSGSAD